MRRFDLVVWLFPISIILNKKNQISRVSLWFRQNGGHFRRSCMNPRKCRKNNIYRLKEFESLTNSGRLIQNITMKRIFPLVLMGIMTCCCSAQTIEYCSNIGPVVLTFDQDSVAGSYLIAVTSTPVNGKIKGKTKDGLFDGIWIDDEGSGRILIGFSSDKNSFSGFYNTSSNPSHWTGSWRASNKTTIKDLPADRQKGLLCESKQYKQK
jgi:hypothetical protein